MGRMLQKIRHDFVMLGKSSPEAGGLEVCFYLSDDNTPFLLTYGTSPNNSGYYKVTASEILEGHWDDHLEKCGAQWCRHIATKMLENTIIDLECLREIFEETKKSSE
ncbi:hypothetical protein ACFL54_04760 [Planctomycetota bacterium]